MSARLHQLEIHFGYESVVAVSLRNYFLSIIYALMPTTLGLRGQET